MRWRKCTHCGGKGRVQVHDYIVQLHAYGEDRWADHLDFPTKEEALVQARALELSFKSRVRVLFSRDVIWQGEGGWADVRDRKGEHK
jgi:hypothetical protein